MTASIILIRNKLKTMKVLIVLVSVLAFQSVVLCQRSVTNKDSLRYPNELKGFQLMQTSKLRNLIPGITTAKELEPANDILGYDCKFNSTVNCKLDENWDVFLTQIDSYDGNLSTIEFYPRERLSFSKVRFSKQFHKDEMIIVHLDINVENFITYRDKYGLTYVIINESTDDHYKKGDLYYIVYGVPEAESK